MAVVDTSCHQGMNCAGVAVLVFPFLKPIEQTVVKIPLSFPCISFRQAPGILAAQKQHSQCRSLTSMVELTHAVLALPATEIGRFTFAQRGLYCFGLAILQESVDESSESAYTGSTGEILLCEYSLQGRISQARILDACLFCY